MVYEFAFTNCIFSESVSPRACELLQNTVWEIFTYIFELWLFIIANAPFSLSVKLLYLIVIKVFILLLRKTTPQEYLPIPCINVQFIIENVLLISFPFNHCMASHPCSVSYEVTVY